ncbi:hypothetical protein P6144_07650 [Sphingomonas sp. HITSZ_GF]|uniref:hypothetical protein n=1 Tax=Sphingomonas sp. HITSZ_GF TaxID=3037247 RepID=UPI00240E1597|nr:hypothetical protein [Sphingomonas sp. HITSZ_GF]MDG2533514.1 hypothetical protein [Sphingomonas sp. HITSZ_GF]
MHLDLRNPLVGLGAVLVLAGFFALMLWLIGLVPGWGREIGWALQALGFGGAAYLGWKHRKARKPA